MRLLLPVAGFWFALGITATGPACADAAIIERISALTVSIEQNPENQALRLQRALAYAGNNQQELALADVLAVEAAGDSLDAALTHGILLYKTGEYAAARPYFDRYLQAHPRHPGALTYRARTLRDLGESRLALADYETLITHSDSLDPGYYLATAQLMSVLPDRGVPEALALLDTSMAKIGPVTPLQRYAIELETDRKNYGGAIERLARMDQRLKATPQWQIEIAQLLLLDGQPEEALPYLALAQEQLQSGMLPVHQELLKTVQRLQEQTLHAVNQACGISMQARCPQ